MIHQREIITIFNSLVQISFSIHLECRLDGITSPIDDNVLGADHQYSLIVHSLVMDEVAFAVGSFGGFLVVEPMDLVHSGVEVEGAGGEKFLV